MKRAGEAGLAVAVVATRGVGPTSWPSAKDTHLRRRFALLGQTLDGMRVWDARRALAALRTVKDLAEGPMDIFSRKDMAAVAFWTAVFEPDVKRIMLEDPPATVRDGPALLNLDRVLGMPQALALLGPREVVLIGADPASWAWARDLASVLHPGASWPEFRPAGR